MGCLVVLDAIGYWYVEVEAIGCRVVVEEIGYW